MKISSELLGDFFKGQEKPEGFLKLPGCEIVFTWSTINKPVKK